MSRDKQLQAVALGSVVEKRSLGQALNVKEFAVLAGISYSTAREWFRLPGFPVFYGVVFWRDFERWRDAQTGLNTPDVAESEGKSRCCGGGEAVTDLPPQVARIIAEFG